MTGHEPVALADLAPCFEGAIPAVIATACRPFRTHITVESLPNLATSTPIATSVSDICSPYFILSRRRRIS